MRLVTFVCLRAWTGLDGKAAGFGSTDPPRPLRRGVGSPPPTAAQTVEHPSGHTLAGGGPRGECIHACVADTACVAAYATARILVWHIMQIYSCRCGRYSVCSRICNYMPCMHAYVAAHATACVADHATAPLPMWRIVQCVHACMADYATACMLEWRVMQLHACLCGTYH